LIGTIVNAASIVIGALLGTMFRKGFSAKQIEAARTAVGLVSILIGIGMFSSGGSVLVVLLSLVLGSIAGEVVDVERVMDSLGTRLRSLAKGDPDFIQSFYASTLLFAVGPMAILGPLHEAMSGDMSILLSKSMIDGISSVALSASMGPGVALSSVPVAIYQAFFFVVGMFIGEFVPELIVSAITATGGALIVGIGLNLLGVTKLRVGNMLPSLVFAAALAPLVTL